MELRMLLAIILSFGVFFLYQLVFVKKAPLEKKEPAQKAQDVETLTPGMDAGVKALDETPLSEKTDVPTPVRQGRIITVSTPLYVTEFAENGGALKTFKLKKYKESLDADASMKELVALLDESEYTLGVSFLEKRVDGLENAVFKAVTENDFMHVTNRDQRLDFAWTSPEGVTILKTYTFAPHAYEIGLEIKVRNLSPEAIDNNLTISLRNNLKRAQKSRYVFSGPAALIDGGLKEIKIKETAGQDKYVGRIGWMAYEDQYFVSAIIPEKAREASIGVTVTSEEVLRVTYIDPSGPVAPRTERTYSYRIYFGPKSLEILDSVGADLAKIVDFGFFDIIAKPLLHMMNFMHRYVLNYGIVIIIITIFVKILFWPLSNKSYQSMSQMKKLQPKMAEIRAKYKDNKKMMNQELMALYKLYKINPLGGCLPMVSVWIHRPGGI